jgi:hypothetical protein
MEADLVCVHQASAAVLLLNRDSSFAICSPIALARVEATCVCHTNKYNGRQSVWTSPPVRGTERVFTAWTSKHLIIFKITEINWLSLMISYRVRS